MRSGFVYRGSQLPELTGHYFYIRLLHRLAAQLSFAGGSATDRRDWGIPSPGNVTSFGEDSSGELYVLTQSGGIYKIVRQ